MTLQEKVLIVIIIGLLLFGISLTVEASNHHGARLNLIHATKGVTVNVIYRSKPTFEENMELCRSDGDWLLLTRQAYTYTCEAE